MARRIRDTKLDTRTARLKLPQRREPYWRPLSAGLALGYRRGKSGGYWLAKHYSREHGRRYESIGPADDTLDAGALSFDAAQIKRVNGWQGRRPSMTHQRGHSPSPARVTITSRSCVTMAARRPPSGMPPSGSRRSSGQRSADAMCNR